MKSRSFSPKISIVFVSLFLLILLVWGLFSGNYYGYLKKGGPKRNPESTVFIPKRSPLMVSLLVNPDRLGVFANLLPSSQDQKRVLKSFEQLRTNLLSQAQVESVKDIQDWLGDEITFAVTSLDYDHDRDNGVKPGYLLAVKNTSPELAREFLQSYYSKQAVSNNAELILDEYKGVKLVYQKPLTPDTPIKQVAAAVVADYVLFANDLLVLKDALNNAQAVDLNLAHDVEYQNSIVSLPSEKVSIAYLNLPSTSAWITNKSNIENPTINQSLTVSLSLNPQGLVTHTALSGVNEQENQSPRLSNPPQTLAYIPSESIFTVAGLDLQKLWQEINVGLIKKTPFSQILYQSIHPLEESLQLDLGKEIFPQVTGEYALSLSINQENKELDWLFVNEQNQETSLTAKLDILAKERGLSVGNLPLANNTITAWTNLITTSENNYSRLSAEVKGVHTKKESYEILTNSVNVLSHILSHPEQNLLQSSEFQGVIHALPSNNDGYLYVRWQPLKPYLVQKFPIIKIADLTFKPLFDNLQSLTITSEGVEKGIQKSTIFFNLNLK